MNATKELAKPTPTRQPRRQHTTNYDTRQKIQPPPGWVSWVLIGGGAKVLPPVTTGFYLIESQLLVTIN